MAKSKRRNRRQSSARSRAAKQRAWTQDELQRLVTFARRKFPAAHVARALHRSLNSTKKKASRLGLHLGADDRWSQREVRELKALAKEGKSIPYIALVLHRALVDILKAAYKHRVHWICGDVSPLS
jgi:hypothetical protein